MKDTKIMHNENARGLKDFQIYDASINLDPENISIVKTLDKNKICPFDSRKFEKKILCFYIF